MVVWAYLVMQFTWTNKGTLMKPYLDSFAYGVFIYLKQANIWPQQEYLVSLGKTELEV